MQKRRETATTETAARRHGQDELGRRRRVGRRCLTAQQAAAVRQAAVDQQVATEAVRAGLDSVFAAEWRALDPSDQTLILRDCTEDGAVDCLAGYQQKIGRGNLASYARTQRVRFADDAAEPITPVQQRLLAKLPTTARGGLTDREREQLRTLEARGLIFYNAFTNLWSRVERHRDDGTCQCFICRKARENGGGR